MNYKTRKKILTIILMGLFSMYYCGSAEVKKPEQPKVEKLAEPEVTAKDANLNMRGEALVDDLNAKLADKQLQGFAFKATAVSPAGYKTWAKNAAPVISEVLKKMPAGYVLEIKGHSCAVGGDKKNMEVSRNRASNVKKALQQQGISTSKMVIKGAGKSELKNSSEPEAAENRRVTFQIIKK